MPKQKPLVTPRRFNDSLGELVELAYEIRQQYAEAYEVAHSRRPAYDDQTLKSGSGDPTGSIAASQESSRNLLRAAGHDLDQAKRTLRSVLGAVRKSVLVMDAPGGYNPDRPKIVTDYELAMAREYQRRRARG